MLTGRKYFNLLIFLAGNIGIACLALGNDDMEIVVNKVDGNLVTELIPENGLNAGDIKSPVDRIFKIKLRNNSGVAITIEEWDGLENCFKFKSIPDTVGLNEDKDMLFAIDTEGLSGKFNKNIVFQIKVGKESATVVLPVEFIASVENFDSLPFPKNTGDSIAGEGEFQIKFKDYKEGGLEKYPEADAWIFAGENCPGCNYLKMIILPRLFEKEVFDAKPIVMEVNLDKKENFIFLTGIEDNLKTKGDKTPILYWKGKLFYGNDSVKKTLGDGGE